MYVPKTIGGMFVCISATSGQFVAASARRQLAGSKIGRFLERLGFGAPQSLLKCRLRGLPLGFQPPKRRLACGGQRPAPLSTIAAGIRTDRSARKMGAPWCVRSARRMARASRLAATPTQSCPIACISWTDTFRSSASPTTFKENVFLPVLRSVRPTRAHALDVNSPGSVAQCFATDRLGAG